MTTGDGVTARWSFAARATLVAACPSAVVLAGGCSTASPNHFDNGAATSGGDSGGDDASGAPSSGADGASGSGAGNPASADDDGGSPAASGPPAGARDAGAAPPTSGVADEAGSGSVPPDGGSDVCSRWTADRADLSEGTWTGSVSTCTAGDIGAPGRANALKLVNLYRFLAGMPAVVNDPSWDSEAQQCALIQSANVLSHSPPSTAKCYTAAGADGSARSDLSSGPGVQAIDGYMQDLGDATTMGHRRWILNNQLGPVGFGSAIASCFMNTGGKGNANKPFVAWPPAGPVPYAAITTTAADQGGWTIQSDTINISSGTVSVVDGTQSLMITQGSLPAGYGSTYTLRFVPSGWKTQAGHSYKVAVSGTSVTYTVQVLNCP